MSSSEHFIVIKGKETELRHREDGILSQGSLTRSVNCYREKKQKIVIQCERWYYVTRQEICVKFRAFYCNKR